MTTDTTSTTPAPLTLEARESLQRGACLALAEATKRVREAYSALLVGQTIPHPYGAEVLCTIKRARVDGDGFLLAICSFTNPETGEVEEGEFLI